jgi:hypothetical protein
MSTRIKIAVASALLGITAASGIALAHDDHRQAAATFRPAQGISFDVGSKRAVGYYTVANGQCNLTLVLSEAPDADGLARGSAARFKVAVHAGSSARVDTVEGKSLEFGCQPEAAKMNVRTLEQLAAVPARY